jgi:protein-tyrosine kinase
MSSLIEQAANRLAQLRQAGVDVPAAPPRPAPPPVPALDEANEAILYTPADDLPAQSSRRIDIDMDALVASGIVSPHAPRSQIADQFRVIKRPLIKNAMGKGASLIKHGNLIMVTSALPGEGKSFTALNLAMSIATELDNTVMLVDADVARPSVMRMLGLPIGPGLLDLVQDESVDLSSVLLKTNIEKLTILPSGTPHPRATELLASDAMTRLLEDIATRYADRIIVFDSPPLLPTTESRVLATHMGQIVLVVSSGKTLQSEVRQALATIESCPVKLLLLNKANTVFKGGYGYGYGYGYGQEQEQG